MLASGSMIRTTISSTSPTRWVLRRSSITTTKTTPIASWAASSTAARSADWPLCGRRDRELDELERLQAETGRGESRSCSAEDVLGYPIERSPNVRPGGCATPSVRGRSPVRAARDFAEARGHAERWPEWTEQRLSDLSLDRGERRPASHGDGMHAQCAHGRRGPVCRGLRGGR